MLNQWSLTLIVMYIMFYLSIDTVNELDLWNAVQLILYSLDCVYSIFFTGQSIGVAVFNQVSIFTQISLKIAILHIIFKYNAHFHRNKLDPRLIRYYFRPSP